MSSSIMKTLQIRKATSLPVSSTASDKPGVLRRRLSTLSLNLTRNQPSMKGDQERSSMKEWWEWSWSLILLKKLPIFITDLEFNKDQTKSSSLQQRGSFIDVFFKLRRLLCSSSDSLPLSCKQGQPGRGSLAR
ncbi:hypothetical protein AALP_AA3G332800 [Arabis alpina]|uniref:Uncharacterized protein n=1 Tax=Arabis alpina TaxID=50452 RepID=A0A087HDB5_ARAAL|nr:hypothetical protein AALP_AA3G332800 [Arabis alpina]